MAVLGRASPPGLTVADPPDRDRKIMPSYICHMFINQYSAASLEDTVSLGKSNMGDSGLPGYLAVLPRKCR